MTEDEIYAVLMRYHREVFMPDFEAMLCTGIGSLREEMRGFFEEMNRRFDRLESTYHWSVASDAHPVDLVS